MIMSEHSISSRSDLLSAPVDTASAGASAPVASAVSLSYVFWGVDLQPDFMFPSGRLYVPGAEKIIHNVNRLVEPARHGQVFLVTSADAHNADDPELRQWPPHCLKGTPGAELIPEALALNHPVIPNQREFSIPVDLPAHQQVILEKNTLDVFDNPNTEVLLDLLSSTGAVSPQVEFVVFGVATEYCVRCTVEGLLRRRRRVALVADAIQSIETDKGQSVLKDLQTHGARLLTTDQALALL
jgi:nicotinamidase/pyrazinamidase